jgi:hypothetical protein
MILGDGTLQSPSILYGPERSGLCLREGAGANPRSVVDLRLTILGEVSPFVLLAGVVNRGTEEVRSAHGEHCKKTTHVA